MQTKSPLATAPLFPLLIKLILPAIFAQIVIIGYNIIDRVYIGRLEDSYIALAALGITVPATTAVYALAVLFGRGGSPLSSIKLGARDIQSANHVLSNTLSLLIIASILSMIGIYIFAEDILYLLGGRDEVLHLATEYLIIYNWGTPFVFIGLGLNFFINAQGFTKIGMITPLIGGISNILLNPVFIFWLDMGVAGAAVATIIAQGISFVWVMRFFFGPKTQLHLSLKDMPLCRQLIRKICTLGSAPAFMVSTEAIVLLCFNKQLFHYGDTFAVGSMTIIASLFLLVLFPMIGVMQGTQPVLSYNYGAGNIARVKKAVVMAFKVNIAYAVLVTGLMLMFPRFFIGLFTHDMAMIEATIPMLQVYMSCCCFLSVIVTFQDTYNAIGDGGLALFFAVLRKGILLTPLLYILPKYFDDAIFAIMLAEPISDCTAALISGVYFIYYAKRKLKDKDKNYSI